MKMTIYLNKYMSIFFFLSFFSTINVSYAHTLSITKVGIRDYTVRGAITASELTRVDTNTFSSGMSFYYNTPFWHVAVGSSVQPNNCPDNKEVALKMINEKLRWYTLKEVAVTNNKDSHFKIYCRVEGNKGTWRFDAFVSPPKNTGGKGCQVTIPNVMNFGTVEESSKKLISTGIYIYCDKDSMVKMYFGKTERPGFLTMGGTVVKFGFSNPLQQHFEVNVEKGQSDRVEFTTQLVSTGSEYEQKIGYILMVAEII